MSGANTFFNAMQWWNDEIQTSQLKQINESLNNNLHALKAPQETTEANDAALKAKSAKNAVFSARRILDEVEEYLPENPNISLFLYAKVIEAMGIISEDYFDEFSDKEYFLSVENKYRDCGEQLKQHFGEEYIFHLQNYVKAKRLYRFLHNLGFYKEMLEYMHSNDYRGFWGLKRNEFNSGIRAIGKKWKRVPLADHCIKTVGNQDPRTVARTYEKLNNGMGIIGVVARKVCESDCFDWGDYDQWINIAHENLTMFIEPLGLMSKEVQEKTLEYTGEEVLAFGHDFDKT